jgi:hypothetical protein
MVSTTIFPAAINCIGIGFQRGTHSRWRIGENDLTGAPTLTHV